jgi:two-component system cell cycle sensor histidine kinase/response regulator CckA
MSEAAAESSGATILLVEDDESVRFVLRKSLTAQGYRVLEADNGSQALDLVESGERIDLVVTDVVMPVMGGFELAARLAAERAAIKVLLISGYTQADGGLGGNRILAEGTDFLRKPFSMQKLGEKVAAMLGT